MGLKVERGRDGKPAGSPVSIYNATPGTAGRDKEGDLWVRMDGGAACFVGTNTPLLYSSRELRDGEHTFVTDDRIEVTITIRE